MIWLNFLHFYQPANQQKDILDMVVNQCYLPIFDWISKKDGYKVNININGCLLEQLDNLGYSKLIDMIKTGVISKKIELLSTAKFHAFLPLMSDDDIHRQIMLNNESLQHYFGKNIPIEGFFPPEMGYSPKLLPIVKSLGFKYLVLDEIAYSGGLNYPDGNHIYTIDGSGLYVFFRNRRISNMIMSSVVRDVEELYLSLSDEISYNSYINTGMDGETFGHHRVGLEKFLFSMLSDRRYHFMTFSDFINKKEQYINHMSISCVESTWASSPTDIKNNKQYLSWKDSDNIIHYYQWELLNFVKSLVDNCDKSLKIYPKIKDKMDIALASDAFWWASANPWWSIEMIEIGAFNLLEVVRIGWEDNTDYLNKAITLYQRIVSTAFDWQRSGKIRELSLKQNDIVRIPFKDRTVGKGGAEIGVYEAFVNMMKSLEIQASEKRDYEKAILWRDALYKLENKLDIFDSINAIDLVRNEISNSEVEDIIKKYKDRYNEIKGGQPEQRDL